jgi:hypothetical protein
MSTSSPATALVQMEWLSQICWHAELGENRQ